MAYLSSKNFMGFASTANNIMNSEIQYMDFLRDVFETLFDNIDTRDSIAKEYAYFTNSSVDIRNHDVTASAKDAFVFCFVEWLLANRSISFNGQLQPAALVYRAVCVQKPPVHLDIYVDSLKGTKLSMYKVMAINDMSQKITIQDVLHNDKYVQSVSYSSLLPLLWKDEILGLRLLTLDGKVQVGYGIFRFIKSIQEKVADSLKKLAERHIRMGAGKDAVDSGVVQDRIIHDWVTQVKFMEQQK